LGSPYFFERTTYWSQGDENAHFTWLLSLECLADAKGIGDRVYLDIDESKVSPEQWWELHAVYQRYGGDTDQLTHLPARRAIDVHERLIGADLDDDYARAVSSDDVAEIDRILALVSANRDDAAVTHWLLHLRIDDAEN
jgi:hypothetical protein